MRAPVCRFFYYHTGNLGLPVVLVELTSQIFSTNIVAILFRIVATLLLQHCCAIVALQVLPCNVTLRWSFML